MSEFERVVAEVGEIEAAVAVAVDEIKALKEAVDNLPVPEDHEAEFAALADRLDAAGKALEAVAPPVVVEPEPPVEEPTV